MYDNPFYVSSDPKWELLFKESITYVLKNGSFNCLLFILMQLRT